MAKKCYEVRILRLKDIHPQVREVWAEAEQMYEQALQGKETALGLEHYSTLQTVGYLGNLYHCQGKLADAERMLERALQGYKNALDQRRQGTRITTSIVAYLTQGEGDKLLQHLKFLQTELDRQGVCLRDKMFSRSTFDRNLRLAMTLRDCSLYNHRSLRPFRQ
jgi:tetratricopeptide (TPR) repeat protein